MGKKRPKPTKSAKRAEMAGFDYGWPMNSMVITSPDYNDNLRASQIVGCAYGYAPSPEHEAEIPIMSLMVKYPDKLKLAFDQFQTWINATGPDALQAEILYEHEGYYIGFGPNIRHTLWRMVGINNNDDRMVFGVTYIKKIDSRHPHFEDIANYCAEPVAPIYLNAVHYAGPDQPSAYGDQRFFRPIPDLKPILLLNLPIYKNKTDVPAVSGLAITGDRPNKAEMKQEASERDRIRSAPRAVSQAREERLRSLTPLTLHLLRTNIAYQTRLKNLQRDSFRIWQLEQATINQHLWASANASTQYKFRKPDSIAKYIRDYIEIDVPSVEKLFSEEEAIINQARRDAHFLLKSIMGDETPPKEIGDIQNCLRERGFLFEVAGQ